MKTYFREAVLILPQYHNDGGSIAAARDAALKEITRQFGGLTGVDAVGYWTDSQGGLRREPVTVVTVAYAPSGYADAILYGIALAFGHKANQESVYLRYPDGSVVFVKPDEVAHVAA